MISTVQKTLRKLSEVEIKHYLFFIVGVLLFTGFMFYGITKLEFQSDFSKFNPDGIEIIELQEKINSEFSDFSSILIVVELDDSFETEQPLTDIRDPRVMNFLVELTNNLEEESKVESVFSAGLAFREGVPDDIEIVKSVFSQIPDSSGFFDDSYSLTPIIISADVGADAQKVKQLNSEIEEILESSSKPGGIKVTITGEPALGSRLFDFIINDGIFTLILAAITIYLLLLFLKLSFRKALVIILPVIIGVGWAIGSMGWIGIPITVATAAIGSMLLGLGVEYSIFLNSRYEEERNNNETEDAIKNAVSTTGASTVSSGITTMIGFFALSFSTFPVLADLGFVLGTGIAFILISVIIGGPLTIILNERFSKNKEEKKKKKEPFYLNVFDKYGKFLSEKPVLIIIIALVITGILFGGLGQINSEEIDFDTVLPDDMPELVAFEKMENAFGSTSSLLVYLQLDPSYVNSDEPLDIRDPRIIRYVDVLSQKLQYLSYVENVESISFREKEVNNGIIPGTLREQKEIIKSISSSDLISSSYDTMLIRVEFNDFDSHSDEIIRQFYETIDNSKSIAGVDVRAMGGAIVNYEVNKIVGPDSSRTAMIAFILIIVFLFLISRSIKYTILPLVTVVVAIFWILGLIGYFQIPFNSIISSVISMTIGIGIDFGIQISMRFRQELETKEKKAAMRATLKNTLYPMVITVIAALIGFRAMSAGNLRLMADLGNTMSIAITASMFVAISLVAGLMIVFERNKKKASP